MRAATLRVTLRHSPLAALACVALHGGTLAVVLFLSMAAVTAAGLSALIAASAAWSVWRYALLGGRSAIVALTVRVDRTAEFEEASGKRTEVVVAESTLVGAFLTVIHAYPRNQACWPWRLRTVLIVPDMLGAEDYRRLRLLLRLGRPTPRATPRHH